MTDTTSAPPADPGPPPPAPPGMPTGFDRFFSWVSGLGVVRADGWLGGVCGGIAARLRIDPLIVRGIFVVVALFGFPALLVYAIAWALLPDTAGRIHLRELFHGRYDAAMTGVFILAFIGFVPVVPWLRNVLMWPLWALTGFAPWAWNEPSIWSSPLGALGTLLGLAIVGGLVFLIVRSVRAGRPSGADARQASAPSASQVASDSGSDATSPLAAAAASTADPAGRAPAGSATGGWDAAPRSAAADPGVSGEGPAVARASYAAAPTSGAASLPSADASAPAQEGPDASQTTGAEVADWRARQEAWRVQNDAWRRSQQDADRAAREQARRERHAHGAAFAVEAEERRRVRRATRPRTSFVFVLTALGAALVTGALVVLTALAGSDSDTAPFAGAMGLFAAALVTALAMVVAGAIRRRSGFLTAVTIVLLVIGGSAAAASGPERLAIGSVYFGTASFEQQVTQPFGTTFISVNPLSESESVSAGDIAIRKGGGDTSIEVYPGATLQLDATLGDGNLFYTRVAERSGVVVESGWVRPDPDGTWRYDVASAAPATDAVTTQRVALDQGSGEVRVTIYER